ncbi:MAG: hypothetical protein GX638_18915 [Crenarchaeota archaeon]|nr:hypothetical protein [Thermoproteota archaeon]
MYTVIDSVGKEIRTHNMFRVSEPFPGVELAEGEQLVEVPDTLLSQINSAYECIITVDAEGTATGITVTKTMEQYRQENPPPPMPPTETERLEAVEMAILALMG